MNKKIEIINNSTRTKKALLNLITSFASQMTSVFVNIITLKFFIEMFGSEMNGLISTIMQVLIYLKLVEAGIGMASIQALYKPISQHNWNEINSILSATKGFYVKSGYFFGGLVCILALILPSISETQIKSSDISMLVLIMSVPSIVEFFFQGKMRVLVTADQKLYIINSFYVVGMILSAIIRIFLLTEGYNVFLVQSAYSITSIASMLLLWIYTKQNYQELNFNSIPNYKLVSKRWAALVHQLTGLVVNGSPLIIISIFFGFTQASIFGLYNLIFSTVTNFMWMFSNSVTPGFGELLTKERESVIQKAYSNFESFFLIVLTIVYTSLTLLTLPFIEVYTRNIHDADYIDLKLLILFTIVNSLNTLRIPANNMINASGHFQNTKKQALIEMVLNLSSTIILINFIGIYGVLAGGIISFSYRTVDIIRYNNKFIVKGLIKKTIIRISTNVIISTTLICFFINSRAKFENPLIFVSLNTVLVIFVVLIVNMIIDFKAVKENYLRISKTIKLGGGNKT